MPPRHLCMRQAAPILPRLTLSSEAVMTAQILRAISVGVLCLLGLQSHAQSAKPDATTSIALQNVTIGERGTELLLRFDRPINHGRSWISLMRDARIADTIHFRLQPPPTAFCPKTPPPPPATY